MEEGDWLKKSSEVQWRGEEEEEEERRCDLTCLAATML